MEVNAVESVIIAATPEVVWAYRLDYHNLPAYNPHVHGLEQIAGDGTPGVGAAYRFQIQMGDSTSPCVLTVREARPFTRIVNDMEATTSASEICTFELHEHGTCMQIDMTASLPDDTAPELVELMAAGGRSQLRLELDNIKHLLESGT